MEGALNMRCRIKSRIQVVLLCAVLSCVGCKVSKEIVNLSPPREQPSLQQLESNLNYVDPDAGQPNYRRDD